MKSLRSFLLAAAAAVVPVAVLTFLRRRERRRAAPSPADDLGAVLDEHLRSEFALRDAASTMKTMSSSPYVNCVPTLAGGVGAEEVRQFLTTWLLGKWPDDTAVTRVSRTVGADRVVDELIVSFTHDVEMPALLPRIAPTGRKVELPHVVVVQFENGKVAHEHVYWDQASLLAQVGLLDDSKLPVIGAEQARRLVDPGYEANLLIRRARKSRKAVTRAAHGKPRPSTTTTH